MYKTKSLALVALTILLGGIFTNGSAQRRLPPPPLPPQPVDQPLSGSYKLTVSANQLSTGEVGSDGTTTYGWTSYGTTDGDLPGFIFISMNYAAPDAGAEVTAELSPVVSKITGGSWSKLIFIDGVYTGSVYGRIVGGQMVWDGTTPNGTISLELSSDGGTEKYVDLTGTGTFEGVWDSSAKSSAPVSGTLVLNY